MWNLAHESDLARDLDSHNPEQRLFDGQQQSYRPVAQCRRSLKPRIAPMLLQPATQHNSLSPYKTKLAMKQVLKCDLASHVPAYQQFSKALIRPVNDSHRVIGSIGFVKGTKQGKCSPTGSELYVYRHRSFILEDKHWPYGSPRGGKRGSHSPNTPQKSLLPELAQATMAALQRLRTLSPLSAAAYLKPILR